MACSRRSQAAELLRNSAQEGRCPSWTSPPTFRREEWEGGHWFSASTCGSSWPYPPPDRSWQPAPRIWVSDRTAPPLLAEMKVSATQNVAHLQSCVLQCLRPERPRAKASCFRNENLVGC